MNPRDPHVFLKVQLRARGIPIVDAVLARLERGAAIEKYVIMLAEHYNSLLKEHQRKVANDNASAITIIVHFSHGKR